MDNEGNEHKEGMDKTLHVVGGGVDFLFFGITMNS